MDPPVPTSGTDSTNSDHPSDSTPENDDNPNREAARYRTRLRDTEAQLQTAQEALQAAHGRADTLAAAVVADHAQRAGVTLDALAAAGHTPGELIGADGTVDTAKLAAAAVDTRKRFGIRHNHVPTQGTGSRGVVGTSWADLLKDRNTRPKG